MTRELTIVSQYFHPEQNATSNLLTELAVELARRGVAVHVVTTTPSYRGISRQPRRSRHAGVDIVRVPSLPTSRRTRSGRAVATMSFAVAAALQLVSDRRGGPVLLVTTPPQMLWAAPVLRRLRRRVPLLLIHDLYPDIAEALGYLRHDGLLARTWRWLNRCAFGHAAGVVVLGPNMGSTIVERYGVSATRIVEIPNWSDPEFISPRAKSQNRFAREHGFVEPFVVQMSGNLGLFQEIDALLGAAERLEGSGILFVFIGEGGQRHKIVDASRRLTNVRVLDFVPRAEVPLSLTACDLSVISLRARVEGLAVPSRLYAAMAAGVPILAIMDSSSDAAVTVQRHRCGDVATRDPDDIARRILALREDAAGRAQMGRNAREAAVREYTVHRAAQRYESVLRSLSEAPCDA